MTDSPTPPDGWYPDPAGGGGLRRWNGTSWTDELRSHDGTPVASAVPASPEEAGSAAAEQGRPVEDAAGHEAGAWAQTEAGVGHAAREQDDAPVHGSALAHEPAAAQDDAPVHDDAPVRGASPVSGDDPAHGDAPVRDEVPAQVSPAAHDSSARLPVDPAGLDAASTAGARPGSEPSSAAAGLAAGTAAAAGAAGSAHPRATETGSPAAPASPGASGYPAAPGASGYSAAPASPGASGYPAAPGYSAAPASPGASGYSAAPAYPGSTAYPGTPGASRPAPRTDISARTVWIWLLAFLPLLGVIGLFLFDWGAYVEESISAEVYGLGSTPTATLINTVVTVLSLAYSAVTVLFAFLDWRQLRARGVERPFHWAWSVLVLVMSSALVYVIGRAVVARRRTGSGLGPMWAAIVVNVVALFALIGWIVLLIVQLLPLFEQLASVSAY
ncbi:DUF2510 domain-containing protein [Microbacterium sp. NPDC090007]|uniref:DUF2510 domain-containing protein n=1 Tax=Microbacterium sp. NPDC090007 TaxID=3364204 RepID=UPI0037F9E43D